MKNKNKNLHYGRVLMVGFLIVQIFFSYFAAFQPQVASAQLNSNGAIVNTTTTNGSTKIDVPKYEGVEGSIKEFLCVPPEDSDPGKLGNSLYDCIGKAYRFGIAFGAIALVFFVVLAGYFYITGGETGKGKGKTMFTTALVGMIIMLSSYVLLRFINPSLVEIRSIQPPIFNAANLPSCQEVGFVGNCVLPGGQVQVPGGGNTTPGSASEAQYRDLILKYATQNGMDYCTLSALIQKESTYNRYAYSNPSGSISPSASPPNHGLSFNVYHAIGLTQITIYPKSNGGWVGDTPARSELANFGKSPLTIAMLLDPETSISAGAKYYGKLYKAYNPPNLFLTYDDFQSGPGDTGAPGKPDSDPATLNKYMDMVAACKKRG